MIPRYIVKEMQDIWSDEFKLSLWLRVEHAAAKVMGGKAMGKCGVVPKSLHKYISKISANDILHKCETEEQQTRHDVTAFVNVLEREIENTEIRNKSGRDVARFIHYGMTSSDVVDTAFAMQLTMSCGLILSKLTDLIIKLREIALEYKYFPILGRTHGQNAESLTVGLVFLSFYKEIERQFARMEAAQENIKYGKTSGAVGTFAHIDPKIEASVMELLCLYPEPISTQIVPRDRHAEVFSTLALVACSLERIATQIRLLSRSDTNEMSEGFGKNQKGSSCMPRKKNPIKTENICGLARTMRGYASMALDNVNLWDQRDLSHSSTERIVAPDSFNVLAYMLDSMYKILSNLNINTDIMARRVQSDKGMLSQHHMLQFIREGKSRRLAHSLVQAGEKPDNHCKDVNELLKHKNIDFIFERCL